MRLTDDLVDKSNTLETFPSCMNVNIHTNVIATTEKRFILQRRVPHW